MNILMRPLLAIDQGFCLIITGQNDLTISAWAYAKKINDGVSFYNDAIDKLFFWQEEHCKNALIWEYQAAIDQQRKFRSLYKKAISK